jgi:hypothetical protein
MLYSSLSNDELERWLFASPVDLNAEQEMLLRVPTFISDAEEAKEAKDELISGIRSLTDDYD